MTPEEHYFLNIIAPAYEVEWEFDYIFGKKNNKICRLILAFYCWLKMQIMWAYSWMYYLMLRGLA
jgi:hypothetical protein